MTDNLLPTASTYMYRVDKFTVPDSGRDEFIARVRETHALLKTLPGFKQDFLLENSAGDGAFNLVTIVEWESMEAIEKAREAVSKYQQENQFNPQDLITRLGIKADRGNYSQMSI